jgi:D-sedoheptulose 7-phosphate isomerase
VKATEWFRELGVLISGIAVTDRHGAPLDLDAGAGRVVERLLAARDEGRTVFLVGNGGSAAIAAHMHSDLAKSVGLRALVFHDIPLMTATVNDDGYEHVFAERLKTWAEPRDLLIAVSSSGRSKNIVAAVDAVEMAGGDIVTLTGFDADNPLRRRGIVNFWVDDNRYGLVEGVHTALTHHLTDRATELGKERRA